MSRHGILLTTRRETNHQWIDTQGVYQRSVRIKDYRALRSCVATAHHGLEALDRVHVASYARYRAGVRKLQRSRRHRGPVLKKCLYSRQSLRVADYCLA